MAAKILSENEINLKTNVDYNVHNEFINTV